MVAKNRTCKLCNEYKDITNFQPQGRQCRNCRNEKQRVYWASLPEEERKIRRHNVEYQRAYREKNREKVRELSRKTHIMRKFNMTIEQYDKMLKNQNGVCAICKDSCSTGNNLAIDHNHTTGKVRALLCKNCNTAIGLMKEDVERMLSAIEYIKSHSEVDA